MLVISGMVKMVLIPRNASSGIRQGLPKVIDVNYYPVEEARKSNMRHRPIGLGVQGLADAFIMLRMPFDSEEDLVTLYGFQVHSIDVVNTTVGRVEQKIVGVKHRMYP